MDNIKTMTTGMAKIKSVADLGLHFAGHRDRTGSFAQWAKANIAFDAEYKAPKEIVAEFRKGALLNFAQLPSRAPMTYRKGEDGIWRPLARDVKPTEADFVLAVGSALAVTPHEMGQLKASDPDKHRLIRRLRDDASTYAAGAWRDLVTAVRRLDPKANTRGANKGWMEAADEVLNALIKRAKSARTKGLEAPEEAKLVKAIAAFKLALK
jgi:hypothetical protein